MIAEPVLFPRTRQGVRDLDQMPHPYLPVSGGPVPEDKRANVGDGERSISLVAGGCILGASLTCRSIPSILSGLAGAALIYRGMTGQCQLNRLIGRNTAESANSPVEMAYPIR